MTDSAASIVGSDVAHLGNYSILLVDDEPNVLKALQRAFHPENYQILTAGNAQEALKLLNEQTVDLIVSDYLMPGMNGVELLQQVKTLRPDTIRIMLTGHADTGAMMGAINDGAVYKFIVKPWNDDDLRVTVSLALKHFELIRKNRALKKENEEQTRDIGTLARMAVSNRSQLAIMLHRHNLLNDEQVQELSRQQQSRKEPIIKLLFEHGWLEEKTLRAILHKDYQFDAVDLADFQVDPAVAAIVPRAFCERQWVVPLRYDHGQSGGKSLLLAMADPMDTGSVDELRFVSGMYIKVVMADVEAIKDKIAEAYGEAPEPSFDDLESVVATEATEGIEVVIEEEDQRVDALLHGAVEAPVVRIVNVIILEAIRLGASDIHIQPRTKTVTVRYRVDGVLVDKIHIPHHLHAALVSRIKVMSELDISERRHPQDGRITVKTPSRNIDLRISTLPTISGEKVVMRILDRSSTAKSLDRIGFSETDLKKVLNMVDKPNGIILATGPTGSGKTTTLYGLLQHNATPTKNYVTIEDPVEYFMEMAGQVLVKEKIGLTFPVALRSILRQDPNVILLGEIRDFETAEVAFHAALTGHLVYSTLHTNSAVATIARLFDLGLKPYLVATALEGIIAQRLVRRICEFCREEVAPDRSLLARLGPPFELAGLTTTYCGKGCPHCHGSGYGGRLGVYEVLSINDPLRDLISGGAGMLEIGRMAKKAGTTSLFEDAKNKVDLGQTTLDEVLRVLGPGGG